MSNEENSGQQTPAQEAPVMDTMPEEGADSGYFGNTIGNEQPSSSDGNASSAADGDAGVDVYRDKLCVNEAGYQKILSHPLFQHYATSVLPNHVGYLVIELPNKKQAEIMVIKDTEQQDEMSGPVMDLVAQHVPTVKIEGEEIVSDTWMQTVQERNIEGDGDNKSDAVVADSYQASNTGAGDGSVYDQTVSASDMVPHSDSNPHEQVPNSEKDAEVLTDIPDPAKMYEAELAQQTKKAEEEQAILMRQRQEEVRQVTQAIQDEMRKQAATQAAEAVKRKKEEEKAAHEKMLSDLKAQLARLQHPPAPSNTQLQQRHTATQPVNPVHCNPMQRQDQFIAGPSLHQNRPVMTPNQGILYQFTNPPGTMFPQRPAGPLYVPTTPRYPGTPQKVAQSVVMQQSSNRRSPCANVSSLAFDASRKQEQPLVRSTPSSCAGTPTIPEQQSSSLFAPIAASSPAKASSDTGAALLSPKSRKRQPTVTGQVLEQFLDRKRAKKHATPTQSPRAKGATVTPMEDLKSQSERKYQLAKSLDIILKETLKQGNFNKIRRQLDEAGLQAIPVPEPFPKDLFCYTVSMYVGDIDENEPDARAAIVRKNCIDYIVSQMLSFAEEWMTKYCEEKQTDPFGWLSKHKKAETKVDGLFVVLMAAYLRRPIQIFSHGETWSSDANIDGTVNLIFAGDNDFTAVEVAEKTFWTQLNAKLGLGPSSVAALFRIYDIRKKNSSESDASTNGNPRSDSEKGQKKTNTKLADKSRRENKKKKNEITRTGRHLKPNSNNAQGTVEILPSGDIGESNAVANSNTADIKPTLPTHAQPQKESLKVQQNSDARPISIPKSDATGSGNSSKPSKEKKPKAPQNGLVCSVCQEQFQWQRELDAHLEIHGIGYECAVCKVILPTSKEYAHHRISTHYVCNIGQCDYFYGYPNGLTFHIQRKHGQEPNFPCLKCGVSFKSSLALYRHELKSVKCNTTTTIVLYKCQNCGTMVSENSRTEHDKTCNGTSEENNAHAKSDITDVNGLTCKFCQRVVSSATEKDEHESECYSNPSKEMQCKLCNKIFKGAHTLGKHLMEVHKQAATLCIYCHHGFPDKDTRQTHYASCPGKNVERSESDGMTLRTQKTLKSRPLHQ